jgi:hypothetical protein
MKKIALLSITSLLMTFVFAQDTLRPVPVNKPKTDLSGRANDHLLLQIGYASWAGKPDSISPSGFSKSLNAYFMFDFPFKTNPKLSIALGPGISTDNIIFKETFVGIAENSTMLQFSDRSDTNHFKKTKLTTVYLEAPIEFRFSGNPERGGSSLKFAIGVKVGTLLKAYTKNKDLQNSNDAVLRAYTMKEASKRYFNSTRLSAHARIGWGHFSLYGSYQLTTLLKDGTGAAIRPYSVGLTLSGL